MGGADDDDTKDDEEEWLKAQTKEHHFLSFQ
jgi:hypothetical protein